MAEVERIADWRGEEVLDETGAKIGKLDEVYVEVGTERSVFGRVKSGLLGRHTLIVPLIGATVGRGYVRVISSPEQHEHASKVKVDAEVLTRDTARELGAIYGLTLTPDADYESVAVIDARRQRTEEARLRAEELEQNAQARAEDSQIAQGAADRSAADAELAEREAEQAARRAAEARAAAEARGDQP